MTIVIILGGSSGIHLFALTKPHYGCHIDEFDAAFDGKVFICNIIYQREF